MMVLTFVLSQCFIGFIITILFTGLTHSASEFDHSSVSLVTFTLENAPAHSIIISTLFLNTCAFINDTINILRTE